MRRITTAMLPRIQIQRLRKWKGKFVTLQILPEPTVYFRSFSSIYTVGLFIPQVRVLGVKGEMINPANSIAISMSQTIVLIRSMGGLRLSSTINALHMMVSMSLVFIDRIIFLLPEKIFSYDFQSH